MKRALKWLGLASLILFAGIQLVPSERTNPPAEPAAALPMHPVFQRACSDCHSNQTRWPWYSHVAPASWFLVGHVNHARSHLNVSEWTRFAPGEAAGKLAGMCRLARKGAMPLGSYLLLHRDARLSAEDLSALCDWTERERARIAEAAAAGAASGASPSTGGSRKP